MKKFTKGILFTALGAFLLGVVLTIIAAAGGGINEVWRIGKESLVEIPFFGNTNFGFRFTDDGKFDLGVYPAGQQPVGIIDTGEQKKVEGEIPVKSVYLEIGYGDVKILPSEDQYVYYSITGYVGDYKAGITEDGMFTFTSGEEMTVSFDKPAGEIIFYIPDNIEKEKYIINMGVGNLEIKDITGYDRAVIQIGAGECDIDYVDADIFILECGAGNAEIDKLISFDIEVNCGCGNFEAELLGEYKDYNYQIEAALGNITVGNKEFTGMVQGLKENNGANKEVIINCGLGNVELSFE